MSMALMFEMFEFLLIFIKEGETDRCKILMIFFLTFS